jgi:hypothetical protein
MENLQLLAIPLLWVWQAVTKYTNILSNIWDIFQNNYSVRLHFFFLWGPLQKVSQNFYMLIILLEFYMFVLKPIINWSTAEKPPLLPPLLWKQLVWTKLIFSHSCIRYPIFWPIPIRILDRFSKNIPDLLRQYLIKVELIPRVTVYYLTIVMFTLKSSKLFSLI